jgi:hypothetical protein
MQITLPPEAQAIIDRKLASGECSSQEAVIMSALVRLDLDTGTSRVPRSMIQQALDQSARGEVLPWTDELRAEIRRSAREMAKSGSPVSDDIVY